MSKTLACALLKHWRRKRGMSQLDLALAADVSARHISFIETGRARPSETMLLRILGVLSVPARDQNETLKAAGFRPRFSEASLGALDANIRSVLQRMMQQQEPFPLTVLDRCYNIVGANAAARNIFAQFSAAPANESQHVNLFDHVFDPARGRNYVQNWQQVGSAMVSRLHREALQRAGDDPLWHLLDRVLNYPDVPKAWRQFVPEADASPVCPIILKNGEISIRFMTTVTVFSMPRDATVEDLRIESYFPMDEATANFCAADQAAGLALASNPVPNSSKA